MELISPKTDPAVSWWICGKQAESLAGHQVLREVPRLQTQCTLRQISERQIWRRRSQGGATKEFLFLLNFSHDFLFASLDSLPDSCNYSNCLQIALCFSAQLIEFGEGFSARIAFYISRIYSSAYTRRKKGPACHRAFTRSIRDI